MRARSLLFRAIYGTLPDAKTVSVPAYSYIYDDSAYPANCILQELFPEPMQEVFLPSRNLIFNQHGVFSAQEARNGSHAKTEIHLSQNFADKLAKAAFTQTSASVRSEAEYIDALESGSKMALRV